MLFYCKGLSENVFVVHFMNIPIYYPFFYIAKCMNWSPLLVLLEQRRLRLQLLWCFLPIYCYTIIRSSYLEFYSLNLRKTTIYMTKLLHRKLSCSDLYLFVKIKLKKMNEAKRSDWTVFRCGHKLHIPWCCALNRKCVINVAGSFSCQTLATVKVQVLLAN